MTPSGLVVHERSLRPEGMSSSSFEGDVPNANDPASVPPGTVGPPAAVPGDPNGVEVISEGTPPPWPRSVVHPSAWSGWPAEWSVPLWGHARLEELTDIAWMCLDLNTWVMSSMPPYLVNAAPSLDDGWLINPDPDIYDSWEEFARQLFWDLWTGEAFVLITARYSTGWPARFHVVEPWFLDVEIGADGLRHYKIGERTVPREDIVHLRYKATASQARGTGPLEVGRARLVQSALLNRYASNFIAGGAVPTGIITHPDELTAEQSQGLQTQWLETRMANLGMPAVLSGGIEFSTVQLGPRDMALVELSQLTESRIAVLMGTVPFQMGLPSGGDSMTYSNVTSLFDYHWRASLRPKAQLVMRALSQRLLPRGTTVEVNRDAYVQPGPLERAQTWQILTSLGVLTAEQVQEFERFSVAAPTTNGALSSGVLQ